MIGGGRLFGIIVEHEDELYHSKLNIWRPRVDNIEVIHSLEGLSEYKLHDLQDVIKNAQAKNIAVNVPFCE